LLVVCAGFVVSGRKPQPGRDAQPLDEAQRAALLSDMERWLAQEPLQGTPR
jgi:hypothetical protein